MNYRRDGSSSQQVHVATFQLTRARAGQDEPEIRPGVHYAVDYINQYGCFLYFINDNRVSFGVCCDEVFESLRASGKSSMLLRCKEINAECVEEGKIK